MKLCILIPAFNEEGRVGAMVDAARRYGDVVVVDDGSRDGTSKEAQAMGAYVIPFSENRGKGAAIQAGFSYFLKGHWDAVVIMDGDGQHDPCEIQNFLDVVAVDSSAMVIGNRMGSAHNMPLIRKATNYAMSALLSVVTGVNVPDTQCGFRLIRRVLVEKMSLEACRFDVESEIFLEAARFRKDIKSVPITSIYRDEKSKIRPLRDTVRFFKLLMRVLRRRQNP